MTAPLTYEMVYKPKFTKQLLVLPPRTVPQILEKVDLLRYDPAPDAKNKKRLVGYRNPVYRLRHGDYRVLYTFDSRKSWVAVLGVDDRKDIYRKGVLIAEELDVHIADVPDQDELLLLEPRVSGEFNYLSAPNLGPTPSAEVHAAATSTTLENRPGSTNRSQTADHEPLPRELDEALLHRLRVPNQYHEALTGCRTIGDLTSAQVPASIVNAIFDAITSTDYDLAFEQPDLCVESIDDIQRYYDGEPIRFLLQLDPEQQRFVDWAVNGSGPALIKGGPGTGKTIIALYRIKSLIAALRRTGVSEPRILFTSYTNTIVESARQLLHELLGPDMKLVTVITADKLIWKIAQDAGVSPKDVLGDGAAYAIIEQAKKRLREGPADDRRLVESIAGLNLPFLLEEINSVIVAREHRDLDSYLAENRAGRRVRLTAGQRRAIWRVHEERERITAQTNKITWSQLRRRAMQAVRGSHRIVPFDGVLVDEAQDLEPTVLRLLVAHCRNKDRLFLTADPNQSIYGSGFRWADVHADLRFRGRTAILRRNYRSTQEILESADAFVDGAELEPREESSECMRSGPRPTVRFRSSQGEEIDTIVEFVRVATRDLRTGLGSCAVLVSSNEAGIAMAKHLSKGGLEAKFMTKTSIDIQLPAIKVLTMHSAKGLEFPVVAVAGLSLRFPGPFVAGASQEFIEESHQLGRRTLYVAMTRAMARLLVIVPENHPAFGPSDFDATFWDAGLGG